MKQIVTNLALAAAVSCAACASGNVIDPYLTGWQSQRDGYTATFVHQNFAFQRDAKVERSRVDTSGALDWAAYAQPTLAAAIRSRAIFINRGRARVLDRFLAQMRADPGAEAVTQWFAAEAIKLHEQAEQTGERARVNLSAFAAPIRVSEAWSEAITSLAADQGSVRGGAAALDHLRQTAALYYRDVGYEKDTLGFVSPGKTAEATEYDSGLVQQVEPQGGWPALREALMAPRRCERTGGGVSCVAMAFAASETGSKVDSDVLAPDLGSGKRPPAAGAIDEPILPGNGMNGIPTTAPSTIDDSNQRYGW